MAYDQFDEALPSGSQNGATLADSIRKNQNALRDMVLMGVFAGWSGVPTVGTGTNHRPQIWTFSKGVQRLRTTTTWGTSGGANHNPVTVYCEYSGNSGSSWDPIGTLNLTYNADKSPAGFTWS